eukprot:15186954-Alexandrium_andersonii.AAC.1
MCIRDRPPPALWAAVTEAAKVAAEEQRSARLARCWTVELPPELDRALGAAKRRRPGTWLGPKRIRTQRSREAAVDC